MQSLILMSRPAGGATREAALEILRVIVARNPKITWDDLSRQAAAELAELGGLSGPINGWLTNAIKVAGAAADPFTFGLTSKTLTAFRDVGESVFGWKSVSESLREAGRGVFDDALNRFLDALPGGLGNDIRVGNVVTRFWLPVVLVAGVVWFLFFRPRRR